MKSSLDHAAEARSQIAPFRVHRRRFLQAASAGLALSALGAYGEELVNQKPKRVGLIGAGWYGKSDLWRLIQVAPVEVVSICDPDQKLLDEAVEMASQRQKSQKAPRSYGDYRKMLDRELHPGERGHGGRPGADQRSQESRSGRRCGGHQAPAASLPRPLETSRAGRGLTGAGESSGVGNTVLRLALCPFPDVFKAHMTVRA